MLIVTDKHFFLNFDETPAVLNRLSSSIWTMFLHVLHHHANPAVTVQLVQFVIL